MKTQAEIRVAEPRRSFLTLDGLRGVAALIVVVRHVGDLAYGVSFTQSFLAVDMFFLLSGFVIAYAYGERIRQGGFTWNFLKIRLIRLYPLYVLGLLFGVIYRIGTVQTGNDGWTYTKLFEAIVVGLLLIPDIGLPVSNSTLDGPTWTLLPELVANMLYAWFQRLLTVPNLVCVVAFGAAGLIGCEYYYGTLDAGWSISQFPVTLSRLTFSFFGGVLTFKLVGDRRVRRNLVSWACVLGLIAVLTITPPPEYRQAYEVALVILVFPAIVFVACQSEPNAWCGRLFRFLGLISYAVYTVHSPVGLFIATALRRGLHIDVPSLAPASLIIFISGLITATWFIDKYYDTPVRRWLTKRFVGFRAEGARRPVAESLGRTG